MRIYNITDEMVKAEVLGPNYECECVEVDYEAPSPPMAFKLLLNNFCENFGRRPTT